MSPLVKKSNPNVKSVIPSPLELIWVVSPAGIPLHFLDFRSNAEIRRPPAQIRRHPAWISCGPLYNARGTIWGSGDVFLGFKICILVHPILVEYKQGGQ